MIEIEISAPGYASVVRSVRVSPGATERVTVKLAEPGAGTPSTGPPNGSQAAPSPRTAPGDSGVGTWKWVTGGTAVAALGLGVTGVFLSNSAADEWNACLDVTNPRCVQANDRAQTWRVVAITGFIAGGVLATLSAVFWVLDGESDSGDAARACSPGSFELGVECHVRF